MLFLLFALQEAPAAAGEPPRYTACMDLATSDPAKGVENAAAWHVDGGGMFARQCLGMAYAKLGRWAAAAAAFDEAAQEALAKQDPRRANYWAQAGNAWLAAGDAAKAKVALDAALETGTLTGLALGEAHLDRARVRVAGGDLEGARADIDRALTDAPADPLGWLLSATLARRQGDLPRASKDITEALRRSADDPSVQLEAGNIAAASGDEANARTAWNRVIELAPGAPIATAARNALGQFGATEK
jgi:tetratricopeptide (TPR) repeat protein